MEEEEEWDDSRKTIWNNETKMDRELDGVSSPRGDRGHSDRIRK